MPSLHVIYDLFEFYLLAFEASLGYLMHPFDLEVAFAHFVQLHGFAIKFVSVFAFEVLLYSHSKDVLVDGKRHLRINMLNLLLLPLQNKFHLINSHLILSLSYYSPMC